MNLERQVRARLAQEKKREAILAAALSLFSDRSFEGTPMPLVAERAGVGAGTIYRYFPSKQALGNAVYQACRTEWGRALGGATRERAPREALHALWRGLWQFRRDHPEAFRFLEGHHHDPYLDAASRALRDAAEQPVVDLLRRAQRRGQVRKAPTAVLVALVFGAFAGLVAAAERERLTLDEAALDSAERAVWALLAP